MLPKLVDIDVKNVYLKNKIKKNIKNNAKIYNFSVKGKDYTINTYFHIAMLCVIVLFIVVLYDKYQFKKNKHHR